MGNKAGCPCHLSFSMSYWQAQAEGQGRGINMRCSDWEGRNKTVFLPRWHHHLCIKQKRFDKFLKLLCYYRKVVGYEVNTQKPIISYLLAMNKWNLKINTTPLIVSINYLGINIINYVQDLHEENYKTLMEDITELNKYSMCVGRKTQYCHDVSSSQFYL